MKMKNKFLLLSFIILLSCGQSNKSSCMDQTFGGTHKLRKFNIYTETGQYSHGSFFLLWGGYSTGTKTEQKVKFSWFCNTDSSYVISEIEPDRIRVHLDSTITEPYVTFAYEKKINCTSNINYLFDWGDIHYMTVYCKEDDYPLNINIKDL